jgi:hypothetical protein
MEDSDREARHKLPNDLVTMAQAAVKAYLETVGPATTLTELQRNEMADFLARLVEVYFVSGDRETIRTLGAAEVRGGRFVDGGRTILFKDGREPMSGLAVTRASLNTAIEAMKRSKRGQ